MVFACPDVSLSSEHEFWNCQLLMSWECWARINRPSFVPEESLPLVCSTTEESGSFSGRNSTQEVENNTCVVGFTVIVVGIVLLLILYWLVEIMREDGVDFIP